MEVYVSGCVFSSLVYELENSIGDVEGLLLGQITSRITNTITDSQSENLTHERVATIQGFVPFGKVHSFYTNSGHILEEAISKELNDNEKSEKVIGWFSFRRNTQGQVSMRERFIHHNLIAKLNYTPSKEFLLAIFTSHMSRDLSSHKFDYCFCCSAEREGFFEPVQVQILNLGDTSHSEYRLNCHSAQATSSLFHEVIDSYRNEFVDDKGCIQQSSNMHGMYITMMKRLQNLVEVVKGSETTVSSLNEEVENRRKELEECRKDLSRKNASYEVDEKRPLQPISLLSESNQEKEEAERTFETHGSNLPGDDNKSIASVAASDSELGEKNDQGISEENTDATAEGSPNVNSPSFNRRRKQRTPARVVVRYVQPVVADDDDVTDDETQPYSIEDKITGSGPDYEEKLSQNLAMETSSPVF